MAVLTQLRLLLWKSGKTALRSPIFTVLEILLPLTVLYILYEWRDRRPAHHLERYAAHPATLLQVTPKHRISYACDNSQCAEVRARLERLCSARHCGVENNDQHWREYYHFHAFNRTTLDMTIFKNGMFNDGVNKMSSYDFLNTRPSWNSFSDMDRFLGAFFGEAMNLTTPILFGQLPTPSSLSRTCPSLLVGISVIHTFFRLQLRLSCIGKDYGMEPEPIYPEILVVMTFVPVLAAVNVAREIAVERESSMKDYLLVMGMSRATYYTHHLLWALLKSLPAIIGVSALIIYDLPVIGFHFLLAFILFVAAQISMATLIPAFIKKPTIATLCAFVLIPSSTMYGVGLPVPRSSILLSSLAALNPGHAMALAFDALREGVFRGNTVNWFSDARYALTYGGIMIIMLLDIVIYISIAMLIDVIGCSTENIFARFKRAVKMDDNDDGLELNVHEPVDSGDVDVELIDVHKTYSSGEHAVRGVSMKLLRGQVTVLLGHNGAGKSTTFAMIAGITVPTSGTIRIGATSTKNDSRSTIGYCPQYNPIFPKLTVSEHLSFFASLKGLSSKKEYTTEGRRLMGILLLTEKENDRAASLSGGMKRKLSIAISLIGNSKVVLLDEPTAGVDAGARRDIERLLAAQKKERTFLLTTHYTDEAENLGDRIMIMAGGKLVCSGSSHFLNREFGAGYILSCVAQDSKLLDETAKATVNLAEKCIGGVKLERQHGDQFEIWLDKEKSERFPELFQALEAGKNDLGIESYGLSNNTLEQVFLRVGELTGVARQAKVKEALAVLLKENTNRSTGIGSFLKRFACLQYKRLLYEFCELRSVILNLLPIVVFIYSISFALRMMQNNAPIEHNFLHNDETIDPLQFHQCMRLGIDRSLNLSASLRASLPPGSCILIEETETTLGWYEETAMARRPPILATIGRNANDGAVVVNMSPNALLSTSALHLSLVRALTNFSFTATIRYKHMPKENHRQERDHDELGPSPMEIMMMNVIAVCIFLMMQPILMYRSIGFYVVERSIKFTHQQLLTGLSKWLYWSSSFCSDLILFSVNYGFAVGCCFYFDVMTSVLWSFTPLCLLIFCISQVKCYIFQRLFESKSKAENLSLIFLIVSYIALAALYFSKESTRIGSVSPIYIEYLPFLDPHLAVAAHYFVAGFVQESNTNVYGILLLQLAVALLVFVLIELGPRILQLVMRRRSGVPQASGATSAPLLENGTSPVLEVNNLVKAYGKNVAVKGISFGVEQHECFGLLGVNGAGKTSTFEVLTGSATATSGSAKVAGVDCATPARIGYCPQFDALMQDLSGRQNLVVLAALHGYRNPGVVADTVIECVGMSEHANKKSKSYSGGQRRKISVAAALLAQNSLIILDEPTAGIDPVTRRDIWSVICALRDSTNTAIVLTSHSMEEVEALCSRIAILRTGAIVAQGSSQALKSRYGNNFKLTLVVEGKSDAVVHASVSLVFSRVRRINGASDNVYAFEIAREQNASWSEMFSKAIAIAKELEARDYCLSQASLEDAFITLTSGAEVFNGHEDDNEDN